MKKTALIVIVLLVCLSLGAILPSFTRMVHGEPGLHDAEVTVYAESTLGGVVGPWHREDSGIFTANIESTFVTSDDAWAIGQAHASWFFSSSVDAYTKYWKSGSYANALARAGALFTKVDLSRLVGALLLIIVLKNKSPVIASMGFSLTADSLTLISVGATLENKHLSVSGSLSLSDFTVTYDPSTGLTTASATKSYSIDLTSFSDGTQFCLANSGWASGAEGENCEAESYSATSFSSGVGGVVVPIDKSSLLSPYIGLSSTTLVAAVAIAVYVKRVKRRKEKQ